MAVSRLEVLGWRQRLPGQRARLGWAMPVVHVLVKKPSILTHEGPRQQQAPRRIARLPPVGGLPRHPRRHIRRVPCCLPIPLKPLPQPLRTARCTTRAAKRVISEYITSVDKWIERDRGL